MVSFEHVVTCEFPWRDAVEAGRGFVPVIHGEGVGGAGGDLGASSWGWGRVRRGFLRVVPLVVRVGLHKCILVLKSNSEI